ncbi:MAG: biotin/lipoate A/B protein ligase family protein [Candidatus Nanohaloarchaea archaeon]
MKGKASVKVPSGKMVKAEVNVSENELKEVSIRGDFFIEPPEALEELEEELTGLDIDAEKAEYLATVDEVKGKMIGFSAEHVYEAIQEAVKQTRWRIIDSGIHSEAMHHALDEVLLEKMEAGEMRPTLRFWHRKNPAIPFGRFQAYEDEVQQEYVEDNGIEVVRRITGGGAMYSEPGDIITYSMYLPKEMVPEEVEESYEELDRWAVEALNDLGVKVEYRPLNDIEHEDGKVGGAAQLRKQDSVLHHTMLSYDLNTENMLKALRIGKEKVSDKAIESAEKRVAVMSDYIDHSRDEVIEAMKEKFRDRYGGEEEMLGDDELEKAEELAEEKFSTEEWNRKL